WPFGYGDIQNALNWSGHDLGIPEDARRIGVDPGLVVHEVSLPSWSSGLQVAVASASRRNEGARVRGESAAPRRSGKRPRFIDPSALPHPRRGLMRPGALLRLQQLLQVCHILLHALLH